MAQEIANSTLLDTWGSGGNIVEPDISKIIEGWQLGEQPPHEYMNWLQNTFGSKLNHILKNGVASWNNTTQYLAGSTVQYTGNVWLCKATNTNSEPADVNANWKRIMTVDSLTTVLNGYVDTSSTQTIAGTKTFSSNPLSTATQSTNANALTKYSAVVKNTGDETIAGVKTFSSSPIVPTPTTGTRAANKDYVDSVAVTPDASTTVKGIVELATNEETATGTDTLRAITPAGLMSAFNKTGSAPMFACRAWVNFNGTGTVAIRASGNVSSITDNSTGDYTVKFTTAMPDANYSVSGISSADTTGYSDSGAVAFRIKPSVAPTTSAVRLVNSAGAGSILDCIYGNVSVFR